MVAPPRRSSTSSRNALPPRRRSWYSSPPAVRKTTPTCSLFEPGAMSLRATVPVIRRRLGFMSPAEIFLDFDQLIPLRMRDKYANLNPVLFAPRTELDTLALGQYRH